MGVDLALHILELRPPPIVDLIRSGSRYAVESTDQHMIELMLGQTLSDVGPIDEAECRGEVTVESHLLTQPPMCGVNRILSRPWMAAAGVGPQSSGVILRVAPSLEQEISGCVHHKDRKRPMEGALPVGDELLFSPYFRVARIDEDHPLTHGPPRIAARS